MPQHRRRSRAAVRELAPLRTRALHLLQSAFAAHQAGRLTDAEASYRDFLSRNPGFPDAVHNLGVALMEQGRPDRAEQAFRKALELRPGFPPAVAAMEALRGRGAK